MDFHVSCTTPCVGPEAGPDAGSVSVWIPETPKLVCNQQNAEDAIVSLDIFLPDIMRPAPSPMSPSFEVYQP